MKGLDIATSNARYLFLVYNGSVQHWHVAQPLQRAQMRKYLAPSMEKVMQALEKVPGQEEWKVRKWGTQSHQSGWTHPILHSQMCDLTFLFPS